MGDRTIRTGGRGDLLYGRGSSDMKGQVLATFDAIESVMKSGAPNGVPVNLKFLLEGEEEIGSKNSELFLKKHAEKFKADVSLNPDAGMTGIDMPTITYGLRGLAYFEVHVSGPRADLHSGLYGGAVHNPAQALAELIAKMTTKRDALHSLAFTIACDLSPNRNAPTLRAFQMMMRTIWRRQACLRYGARRAYIFAERTGARPTLKVNGLLSGWTGPGLKTVLPAKAMAKISCRLVPDQTDDVVEIQMVRFMEENAPKTVNWEVKKLTGSPFAIADLNNPGVKAMHDAMETVWGANLARESLKAVPSVRLPCYSRSAELSLCW